MPLSQLAAGYEGICGLLTTLSGLFLIYRFYGSTPAGKGGYFDAPLGWHQIVDNKSVWSTSIVIAISIALFNLYVITRCYRRPDARIC